MLTPWAKSCENHLLQGVEAGPCTVLINLDSKQRQCKFRSLLGQPDLGLALGRANVDREMNNLLQW